MAVITKWLPEWAVTCRSTHLATARRSSALATSSRPSSRTRHRPRRSWRSHQPAGSLPAASADRRPDHVGQRDLQDRRRSTSACSRSASRTGTRLRPGRPSTDCAALRCAAWASRVLLPLPGWPTSARTARERRSRSSLKRLPLRGALNPAERAGGTLLRGPADQGDVDVDIAQFRDVVPAGREILHVDVPERVKHPAPVPVAVPGTGRSSHHLLPRIRGQICPSAPNPDYTRSKLAEPDTADQRLFLDVALLPGNVMTSLLSACSERKRARGGSTARASW